jgi:hypothetical protein
MFAISDYKLFVKHKNEQNFIYIYIFILNKIGMKFYSTILSLIFNIHLNVLSDNI